LLPSDFIFSIAANKLTTSLLDVLMPSGVIHRTVRIISPLLKRVDGKIKTDFIIKSIEIIF
jgi:hypothetical protein